MWQNRSKSASGHPSAFHPVIPGLVRHADPSAFLVAASPLLARDEAAAAFYAAGVAALTQQTSPGERSYLATCGDAGAIVAAPARALLGSGRRRLFLVTDVANPTSNAIYGRIGFRPLSDIHHVDFVGADAAAASSAR